MSEPWPPPTNAAHAALEHVMVTVTVANGMAAAGRTVDLAGLDEMAGAMCARILDLPPEDGLGFRAALLDLDSRLAALASVIRGAR